MKILLIEDDLDMQELLIDYLKHYDYEVIAYASPLSAIKALKAPSSDYHLVVLDLMLPELDGFDVCQRIREKSDIPIIISSARGNLGDKIVAFDYGADDYLAKPYEPRELVMRMNAILRRVTHKVHVKKVGEFEIDEDKMQISQEHTVLNLTKIEYEIFSLFLNNPNKILSRESIANYLGSDYHNIKDRAIDMHISNIRNKIFDDSKSAKYIKSVWGIGYKFIG
ncbi:response regulator transcription factor [Sulfurospirillum sp. 1612]|uniref:response regulator transcription factor n=1 Tax=Sulfurospirillum sp. 1612 TaxID=3094835 RepID=UPI002F9315FB